MGVGTSVFLSLLVFTMILGFWSYREHQKCKNQRNFIVIGGISLAVIATILTIISALVSIIVGIVKLYDYFWWI